MITGKDKLGREFTVCANCGRLIYNVACTLCDDKKPHCSKCMEHCEKRNKKIEGVMDETKNKKTKRDGKDTN